jgi:hypothetical protein
MNPMIIAALAGAAIGAGKTALNKKERKKPGSWITNVLGGAASGAAGGAGAGGPWMAALGGASGSLGGGGFKMPGSDGKAYMSGVPDAGLDYDSEEILGKYNNGLITGGVRKKMPAIVQPGKEGTMDDGSGGMGDMISSHLPALLGQAFKKMKQGGDQSQPSPQMIAMMQQLGSPASLFINPVQMPYHAPLPVPDYKPLFNPDRMV